MRSDMKLNKMKTKTVKFTVRFLVFAFIAVLCVPLPQFGKVKPLYTYYDLSYGARSLSMGKAYTAVADDLSAVYINPAGVAKFDGPQVFLDYRKDKLLYSHSPESSQTGTYPRDYTYGFTSNLKNVDFLAISVPVNIWDIKWSFALSYYRYIPYNFSGEGQGRLVTTGTGFTNTDISSLILKGNSGIDVLGFTGAFYLTNYLSFGITVQRFFNSGDITYDYVTPDTAYRQTYTEKISGWNAVLGLLFELDKDIVLGFTYHTRMSGKLNSDYIYEKLDQQIPPVTTTSNGAIVLPAHFTAGLMMRPFQFMKLSFDYSVLYWSKAYVANYFGNSSQLPFPVRNDFSFSQKDNIDLRTGVEFKIPFKKFNVFLRGGLFKDRQLFTDTSGGLVNVKGYSMGIGMDVSSKVKIDFGYMRQKADWNETSYFDTQGKVATHFKNKTLSLSITFSFGKTGV
jgi:long-subunit fatty acid transport protein